MAVQVSYPGVYIEEFAPGPPIQGVGTSTAAFIGPAQLGEINVPTRITSWSQFLDTYGSQPLRGFYLWHAVKGFFLNGGRICYIVRASNGRYPLGYLVDNSAPTNKKSIKVRWKTVETPTPVVTIATKDDPIIPFGKLTVHRPLEFKFESITQSGRQSDVVFPIGSGVEAFFRVGDTVSVVGSAGAVRVVKLEQDAATKKTKFVLDGLVTAGPTNTVRMADLQTTSRTVLLVPTRTQVDQTYTLTLSPGLTAGTFTLSFGGQTTAAIQFNAAPGAIQTELRNLTTIGADATVTPGTVAGTFVIQLKNSPVSDELTVVGTALTGGNAPAVTVTRRSFFPSRNDTERTLTLTNATGGSFTLSFGGQTTQPITFDAAPATLAGNIRTALEAIAAIGANNVTVTPGAPPGTFVVRFGGPFDSGPSTSPLTADATSITGAAAPAPKPDVKVDSGASAQESDFNPSALVPGTVLTLREFDATGTEIQPPVSLPVETVMPIRFPTSATPVPNAPTKAYVVTFRDNLGRTFSGDANSQQRTRIDIRSEEFTLTVTKPGAVAGTTVTLNEFKQLSMDPDHPRYFSKLVNAAESPIAVQAVGVLSPESKPKDQTLLFGDPSGSVESKGLKEVLTTLTGGDLRTALDALRAIDDVNLVAVPDAIAIPGDTDKTAATSLQQAVIAHCEQTADRFAVLDPWAAEEPQSGSNSIDEQITTVPSTRGYAALYYPWLLVEPAGRGPLLAVPPSGHVCGAIARVDVTRGVHKAPANEFLTGPPAIVPEGKMGDVEQGILNLKGINVIRMFGEKARPIIWARAPPRRTRTGSTSTSGGCSSTSKSPSSAGSSRRCSSRTTPGCGTAPNRPSPNS